MPDRSARSEALLAAAELGRRKHEAAKRIERLENEKRGLREVLDALVEENRELQEHLSASKAESTRMAEKTDALKRRMAEMAGEMDQLERDVSTLDSRCSENAARGQELARAVALIEEDILAARGEIADVSSELEVGRTTLARLDQRLSLGRWGR